MIADLPHSMSSVQFAPVPKFISTYQAIAEQVSISQLIGDVKPYRGAMWVELPVAEAKIDEIAGMQDNWDGYGAIRIGQEAQRNAKAALNILHKYAPIPDVTPNPNGTISLEWESFEGFGHLEIGRTRFSFYIKPRSGQPFLADGNADQIDAHIGKWVSGMLFPLRNCAETITKFNFNGNVLRTAY